MVARKALSPLLIMFFVINVFLIVFRDFVEKKGFSVDVLLWGNILLCAISVVSFLLLYKGMNAETTAGFLRSVYGSFMIKFFIVAAAIFIYLYINKEDFNKPAVFASMFLYLVYTFVEVKGLLKLSKDKSNG